MKTLSDLKKDINIGDRWEMLSCFGKPPADKISGIREVCHKQSNSIAFMKNGKKSWLEYPPASLLEYDGQEIKIYSAGNRPLTPAEQSILDNMPSNRPENAEKVKIEIMTDSNGLYWQDKKYLSDNNADWYWGKHCGLYYNRHDNTMQDNKIKGALELHYKKMEVK